MLPSLGFQEIVLLGILALVVVGPKDLPLLLRKLGKWTAKLRGMAQEFRTGFDELARQAELDELKKEVDALRRGNPLNDIKNDMQRAFTEPPPMPLPPPHDVTHGANGSAHAGALNGQASAEAAPVSETAEPPSDAATPAAVTPETPPTTPRPSPPASIAFATDHVAVEEERGEVARSAS
ncbi:MAG: Sec-independent protein translocase protein TatB [Pseudomonadota bacterium]